jgi:hypothetical protein
MFFYFQQTSFLYFHVKDTKTLLYMIGISNNIFFVEINLYLIL